jgi:1-aminocyclopropane-1-carboxylate deaminase
LIQEIPLPYDVTFCIQREDLVHPQIQGNKYRKLKYNLAFAKSLSAHNSGSIHKTLLTFGGAYSNHIAATAIAGKLEGFKTVGIIRGEELGENLDKTFSLNPTLAKAQACGMQFEFVSRTTYRDKDSPAYLASLRAKYNDAYILPEGGTNALAIRGCSEILNKQGHTFNYVCCPVGTGGTLSGIIESSIKQQTVLGFPALKGDFLDAEIQKWTHKANWKLIKDYHFGGYARMDKTLIAFINEFTTTHKIQLDPVYTAKMVYGIYDLISKDYFPAKSRILAIHTGGIQGIQGMNKQLLKKGLPLIRYSE